LGIQSSTRINRVALDEPKQPQKHGGLVKGILRAGDQNMPFGNWVAAKLERVEHRQRGLLYISESTIALVELTLEGGHEVAVAVIRSYQSLGTGLRNFMHDA
jgi:hypothetical protein